jgi:catechol 2,3-dioxygenase-like lactoylglutathione lyase family enzyme
MTADETESLSATVGAAPSLRIDHTGITVSSLDRSLRFWIDALGCRLLTREHFPPSSFLDNVVGVHGCEMTLAVVEAPGGGLVELLEYSLPDDRKVFKPRSCDVGSVHVAVLVDDIEMVLARVESCGWARLGDLQTVREGRREGLRIVYVRGSDGETVELLQAPRDSNGRSAGWRNSLNVAGDSSLM